jgi:hypothetical protein
MGLTFELNASWLQSKCSTAWAPPVHFGLAILEMGVSQIIYLPWSETVLVPFSHSHVARINGISVRLDIMWLGL